MTKEDKVQLLQDLVGTNLNSVTAERFQSIGGVIDPELLAIHFFVKDSNLHVRVTCDSSGQFLKVERGSIDLPDLGEYGRVVTSAIAWGDLIGTENLYFRSLTASFFGSSDDLMEVRITLSDGSEWVIVNECDNLLLLERPQ
jgi:hypothetical protein